MSGQASAIVARASAPHAPRMAPIVEAKLVIPALLAAFVSRGEATLPGINRNPHGRSAPRDNEGRAFRLSRARHRSPSPLILLEEGLSSRD